MVMVMVMAVAVVAWPGAAGADRAVGRTDRLAGGTVELGLGMERSDRDAALESATASLDAQSSQVSAVPRVRAWLADWLDLEVRMPFALERTLEFDGTSEEVADVGMLDTQVQASAVTGRGALVWGGAASVVFPTSKAGFGADHTEVTGAVIGGWRIPSGVVHATP